MVGALKHEDENVRRYALYALEKLLDAVPSVSEEALWRVGGVLKSGDKEARWYVLQAM